MVWPVCEDQLMYGSSMVLPQGVQVVLFWGRGVGLGRLPAVFITESASFETG